MHQIKSVIDKDLEIIKVAKFLYDKNIKDYFNSNQFEFDLKEVKKRSKKTDNNTVEVKQFHFYSKDFDNSIPFLFKMSYIIEPLTIHIIFAKDENILGSVDSNDINNIFLVLNNIKKEDVYYKLLHELKHIFDILYNQIYKNYDIFKDRFDKEVKLNKNKNISPDKLSDKLYKAYSNSTAEIRARYLEWFSKYKDSEYIQSEKDFLKKLKEMDGYNLLPTKVKKLLAKKTINYRNSYLRKKDM